jgi:hypothetical protein
LHNLAAPCSFPGPYGLEQLRAIRNSKLPQGVTEWPDPNNIHAGTTYVPPHLEVIRTLVLPEILRIRAEGNPYDQIEFENYDDFDAVSSDPPAKRAKVGSNAEAESESE